MIYICIPAHDEERTIGVLLWRIRQAMQEFQRDYEVLVLDDASTDGTPEILKPYPEIMPISLLRNERRQGYGASVERLIREAAERAPYPKRDSVVILQADFTEDPATVVELVKRIEGGADMIAGVPEFAGDLMPRAVAWTRRAWSYLFERFDHESPLTDPLSGVRAYRVMVLKRALEEAGDGPLLHLDGWAANAELAEAVLPHARRFDEVPVEIRYDRRARASRFHPLSTSRQLFRLLRSHHHAPIRGNGAAEAGVELAGKDNGQTGGGRRRGRRGGRKRSERSERSERSGGGRSSSREAEADA